MTTIEPVTPATAPAAQALFRQYGLFLRDTQCSDYFHHDTFLGEIEALPAPYAARNGNVLLATVDGTAAACIAYRTGYNEAETTCEIKRLFVLPEYRGQGLARKLVANVLARLPAHGYTRAILDTDLANMPGAPELYASFGFREYGQRIGSIAFFDLDLTNTQPPDSHLTPKRHSQLPGVHP